MKIFNYFGPRILKTGLGVTLALLICEQLNIETGSFAATIVVINMLPSFTNALKNARELVLIHILSIFMAIILGLVLGTSPQSIGIIVVLLIALVNKLKIGGMRQGIVSIIFILDAPPEQFLEHAAVRAVSILIGLAIALVINRILMPPRYKETLKENLYSLFINSSNFFLESIEHFVESTSCVEYEKYQPTELKKELDQVMKLHKLARGEFTENDNVLLIERLIEICRGFIERGENIEEMTRQSVKRRQSQHSHSQDGCDTTEEFKNVLEVLSQGQIILNDLRNNISLRLSKEKQLQNDTPEFHSLDIDYWSELNKVMDQWQQAVRGVFYLRAMMEVAVVATEVRWASKRMKYIYQLINENTKE